MVSRHEVQSVAVWLDWQSAEAAGVSWYYSVSLLDGDGEEVECVGGDSSLGRAWAQGCAMADRYGVPCVEEDLHGAEQDWYTP